LHSILITRPLQPQEEEYARKLGLEPIQRSFLQVSYTAEKRKLRETCLQNPQAAWAFTSQHGVKASETALKSLNASQRPSQIFAVGTATAEALRKINLRPMVPPQQNAAGLAAFIAEQESAVPSVLHFCSKQRRPELGDSLKHNDIAYLPVEVYETVYAEPEEPLPEHVEAALFYSPSVVESFFSQGLDQYIGEGAYFAIGETTAQAVRAQGKECHATEQPKTNLLFDLVASKLNGS
jgi:uroporphyrinogen-III synthase